MINKMIANTKKLPQFLAFGEQKTTALLGDFFACILCQMQNDTLRDWYDHFLKNTEHVAQSGGDELQRFWTQDTLSLRQALAQYHAVEETTLALVLPLAVHTGMGALQLLAKQDNTKLREYITTHGAQAVARLPVWADKALGETLVAQLQVDYLLLSALDGDTTTPNPAIDPTKTAEPYLPNNPTPHTDPDLPDDPADDPTDPTTVAQRPLFVPKPKQNPWLLAGLGVALVLLLCAVAFYFYQQNKTAPTTSDPVATPAPVVVARVSQPSPFLSLTVSDTGDLYACHAKLANDEQLQALMQVLNVHFAQTTCVIDVNGELDPHFAGFDKLKSVIGLLKSASHATLQFRDGKVLVNSPNSEDLARLVADVGALMTGTEVVAMTAPDADTLRQERLVQADKALDELVAGDDYKLTKALDLIPLPSGQSQLDEPTKALLAKAAAHLANRPDTRLIIVVHSDEKDTADSDTQAAADAIKAELVAQGVADDQLIAQGVGSSFAMMDNQTQIGRFYNNRVEFLPYDEATMQALTAAPAAAVPVPLPAPMPAPMPDYNAAPSNFQVIDGQIVDVNSPQGQALLAQQQQQQQQYTPPPQYAPQYNSPPQYVPPPSPPPSPIPDDLLTEIGVN